MARGVYPNGNRGLFKKGENLGNTNGFKKGVATRKGIPAPWARNNPQTFKKGSMPWNKGTSAIKERACLQCGVQFMPTKYKDERKFCSLDCSHVFNSGERNNKWKGGITPINQQIRTSAEYKQWRKHVFNRDDFTCQACGERGAGLHADHELPFALFPDLRFEILNGRTLCVPCHKLTPTYAGRASQIFV